MSSELQSIAKPEVYVLCSFKNKRYKRKYYRVCLEGNAPEYLIINNIRVNLHEETDRGSYDEMDAKCP